MSQHQFQVRGPDKSATEAEFELFQYPLCPAVCMKTDESFGDHLIRRHGVISPDIILRGIWKTGPRDFKCLWCSNLHHSDVIGGIGEIAGHLKRQAS